MLFAERRDVVGVVHSLIDYILHCNPVGHGTSAPGAAKKTAAEYTGTDSAHGSLTLANGHTALRACYPACESAETELYTRDNSFVRNWYLGKFAGGTAEFEGHSESHNGRLDLRRLYAQIPSHVLCGIHRVHRAGHDSGHTEELPDMS